MNKINCALALRKKDEYSILDPEFPDLKGEIKTPPKTIRAKA